MNQNSQIVQRILYNFCSVYNVRTHQNWISPLTLTFFTLHECCIIFSANISLLYKRKLPNNLEIWQIINISIICCWVAQCSSLQVQYRLEYYLFLNQCCPLHIYWFWIINIFNPSSYTSQRCCWNAYVLNYIFYIYTGLHKI